jgi:hypothetical protein
MQRVGLATVVLFLLGVSLTTGTQYALAQTATGSILGTVKDQSGAVVTGVIVTIQSGWCSRSPPAPLAR